MMAVIVLIRKAVDNVSFFVGIVMVDWWLAAVSDYAALIRPTVRVTVRASPEDDGALILRGVTVSWDEGRRSG